MKNFTNNFKQITSRLSARWLIIALMLLLGTSSAWAVNKIQGNCDIYFDNSKTQWTDACIQFVIGHNSYSRTYVMTKQPNSNLYHVKLGTDNTNKWDDATYYAFIGTSSKWGDGGWGPGNITNAPHRTTTYTGTYDLNSGSSYYFVPTSSGDASKNGASFEIGTSYTQTYTVKKSESGTTGGTVQLGTTTLSTSDTSMDAGTYDLTITAPTGYNVSSVTVSGGSLTTAGTTGSNTYSGTVNVTAATTISVTYTCSPSTSIISAMLGNDGKINLKGNFNTCIQQWHGFQWRIKGNDWCQENIPNDNSSYVSIYTNVNGEDTGIFEPKQGKTYEFRTYIYGNTWVYSSETIEVSTCTSIPNNTYAIAGNNVWTGNANPVTINYDANTYGTPTILYDDKEQIPTKVGTYAITINVPAHNVYCASTISLGDYEITCIDVEKPDITASATVCAGTPVTLSNYNGVNINTVKWYSNPECNSEVTEQVTPTDGTKYYAKAYHEASGCYSSQYSTLTFTVNPLPIISISGSEEAVLYEDVTLTATGTNIDAVNWIITNGTGTLSNTTGTSVKLTSSTAGTVKVKATATSENDCTKESNELSVVFSAENCNSTTTTEQQPVGKTKIIVNNPHNWTTMKCYAWRTSDKKEILGGWSGTEMTKNGNNYEILIDFAEKGITENDKIQVVFNNGSSQTVDSDEVSCNKIYRFSIGSKSGDKYSFTSQAADKDPYTEPVEVPVGPEITAPAVKIESVTTTTGLGNINFTGRVVKKGCDDTNEYGFQYSTDRQNWTTVKVGENASAGTQFSDNSVKGLDGIYYIRAYITNDHSTQTSAEKEIRLQTSTDPISNVSIEFVAAPGENNVPSAYCVGSTAYIKATYDGAKYTQFECKSDQGVTLTELGSIPNVFQFTVKGNDNIVLMLRNIYNREGEFFSNDPPLVVNATPEPTAPTISLDKSTLCSNDDEGATISLANTVVGQTYSLFKEIENDDDTQIGNDIECTEQNKESISFNLKGLGVAGRYYVIAKENVCNRTIGTTSVTLEVVNTTGLSISIEPNTAVVTPWEPVKLKITATEGYQYNVTGLDGMVYTVNGDTYTVKIPLPEGDTSLDTDGNVIFKGIDYRISATLITGGDNQCINPAICTITLTPYLEPCTQNN